jgi:WD40 repeat protein
MEDEAPRRFGSYELVEEIARGGMGIVWRARQHGLDRDVALKMILAGQLATSAQVLRFYTEARAAARLDHPAIVPIHEIGEDGGRHFYTMRLMEGGSLAEALRTAPPPPPEEAARIVLAIARAIQFAHQRGVLHRDVKPSNILLDAERKPHIADFGLARIAEEDPGASRSGVVLGTPAYMAPEQAAGSSSEVTTAADVYGLGAVLYELLAGAPPFETRTPLQTLRLVLEAEPAPLRSLNPRIDRDLEVICLKCLQKQPEKRYASAAELAGDLERWLAGEPILARPVSGFERLGAWARRKPELAGSLAAIVVILVVAFGVTLALFLKARTESEARAVALRSEEGQRLAFQSLAVIADNPGQALLVALEAAARAPSLSANNALLASMEACRERRRFLGHEGSLHFVSFSPDGGRVVSAAMDKTARIWDVASGEVVRVFRGHEGAVNTAVFSPDGKRVLTASDDATARIWNVESGEELARLDGGKPPLESASFSPDGGRILTVARDAARLWDAGSARPLHALARQAAEISGGRFSPDGARVVTCARDGTATVWDARTGDALANLPGPPHPLLDVCYSGNGRRIATASIQPEARVWDATTFREVCVFRRHSQGIYSVALSADGTRAVTGSEDFTARIWDADTGAMLHSLPHGHKVWSVAISPDDRLVLTSSYDTTARLWDLATGRLVSEMRGHAAPLNHAAFAPSSQEVVTASVDFTARLWTVRPAQPLLLEPGGDLVVTSADVAADGRRVVEAYLKCSTGRVLDTATRREVVRLEGHEAEIQVARFDAEGVRIVTASADGSTAVWEATTGRRLLTLTGHEGAVARAFFSPDGRLVLTASLDRTVRIWNAGNGARVALYRSEGLSLAPAFSPTSDRVIITHEISGDIDIGELASGQVQRYSSETFGHFQSADFGPEGRQVVTTNRTTRAHVRNLPGFEIVATLVHPSRLGYAVYSPDKRWIATLANDFEIRLWDGGTFDERLAIKRPGEGCLEVHFPAGSRTIAILWIGEGDRVGLSRKLLVYPLDVIGEARKARFGDLTPDERDHFQVGSAEERRQYRAAWRGGHIYGAEPAAER